MIKIKSTAINNESPADAAKTTAFKKKELFISDLIEGFKDFVLDSMAEGMHAEFEDHHCFLKACFETWQEGELDA